MTELKHLAQPPPTASARQQSRRVHPNLIMGVLLIAGLSYSLLSSAVIPAIPELKGSLHSSETGVTRLLTGFLVSASVATAIIGRLGDMFGKERLLLGTLIVLAAGTLLGAVSQSLPMLIAARVVQGTGGGVFPLSISIVRDEFPRETVARSIGLLSSVLGIGGGCGLVVGALIVEHLGWHWLFWIPLSMVVLAVLSTWRYIPESPVRSPGKVNWLAALLMSVGISLLLVAITQTTVWGWGTAQTLGLFAGGFVFCAAWIVVEVRSRTPLIDMKMMRIRGVWTTNLAAFLLGAGMYVAFFVFPQFAQLPNAVGFGASAILASFYLLPSAVAMAIVSSAAGRVNRRYGSRLALLAGSGVAAVAVGYAALAHRHPYEMLISSALLGIGIGLAFAALGNLIVQSVPPTQTGAATGMNTVMRTLGGAVGAQLAATFIAAHTSHGLPGVTGFIDTYDMATAFLVIALLAGAIVPRLQSPVSRSVDLL